MKLRQHRWLLTAAVAVVATGWVAASTALADPYDPYPKMVKDLGDVTGANNGGGLSTIPNLETAGANGEIGAGIHLDAHFAVGNVSACDPDFGCGPNDVVGNDYARVTVGTVYPPNYTGPADLTGYTGVRWTVMSDTPLFVQPWVKTSGPEGPTNYTYFEPNDPISGSGFPVPGDGQNHHIVLNFSQVQNYASLPQGTVLDLNNVVEWGLQLQYNGPALDALGPGHDASIWVTSWVPEPSSFALLGLGMTGFAGFARRRRG